MNEAITETLGRLRGQALWSVGRAGVVWFQFGSRRTVRDARGKTKEVGELVMHLNCPWRLLGPEGELLARDDSEPEVLLGLSSPPLLCSMARVGQGGAFELEFAGGERLLVEPEDPDCEEYWRLFSPYSGRPHFVVGPEGNDPEG
jgi:hypothetical protein